MSERGWEGERILIESQKRHLKVYCGTIKFIEVRKSLGTAHEVGDFL